MAAKKSAAKAAVEEIKGGDRRAALETAISRIERDHGKGAIMRLGESASMNVSAVSTGSLTLDIALGIGGLPKGRVTEIYGPESSGKTTLALHVIAEVQKAGGNAAFIDAEHALDPIYAKKLGVDINDLLVSQPDCGEQALEIAEALVNSGAIDIIVVDSVAALVPKQEIVDNGYDLSINKYKETEYVPVQYPPTSEIMAELRELEAKISVEMDELERLLGL